MGAVGHRHRKGSLNADGRKLKAKDSLGFVDSVDNLDILPVVETGSVPLSDGRHESYCQKVVWGVEPLEAYWQSFFDEVGKDRNKRSTALGERHRIGTRPDVLARIGYLNKTSEGASRISRAQKKNMLDDLLEKTYAKAMSEHASPKEVSVCLDVMARHDMMNGDITKPKVVIEFGNLDSILGEAAFKAIEARIGIKQADGEVVEAEDVVPKLKEKEEKEDGEVNRKAKSKT